MVLANSFYNLWDIVESISNTRIMVGSMIETIKPCGAVSAQYVKDIIEYKDRYFIIEKSGGRMQTTKEEYLKWRKEHEQRSEGTLQNT